MTAGNLGSSASGSGEAVSSFGNGSLLWHRALVRRRQQPRLGRATEPRRGRLLRTSLPQPAGSQEGHVVLLSARVPPSKAGGQVDEGMMAVGREAAEDLRGAVEVHTDAARALLQLFAGHQLGHKYGGRAVVFRPVVGRDARLGVQFFEQPGTRKRSQGRKDPRPTPQSKRNSRVRLKTSGSSSSKPKISRP